MKPMLASKWEARNEAMFPFVAQPKYDGIRILIGEDGYAYTRSLKPIRNYEMQAKIRRHFDVLGGLDGEIIVGDPTAPDCYTRTSSAVMSYENSDIENAKIYVFDIWNEPFSPYFERLAWLTQQAETWPDFVVMAETCMLPSMEHLTRYEEHLLAQGHEGVILRKHDALYKHGRGTPKEGQLIKLKRYEDVEGEIVGFHELMHNANEAKINELGYTERSGHQANLVPMNKLGAIEVRLGPEWTSPTVRIGTGFDDQQRVDLWKSRGTLIGQIAKYKYFAVGTKDAPRFPVFLGFRDRDDMSDDKQGSLF